MVQADLDRDAEMCDRLRPRIDGGTPMRPTSRCPICDREFAPVGSNAAGVPKPAPPFCSQRCKLVDLSKWLGEEYTISSPGHDPLEAAPWLGPDATDHL
jgi:endogenous inhibitor of DNA gyrase (YacG/DUF329 family)